MIDPTKPLEMYSSSGGCEEVQFLTTAMKENRKIIIVEVKLHPRGVALEAFFADDGSIFGWRPTDCGLRNKHIPVVHKATVIWYYDLNNEVVTSTYRNDSRSASIALFIEFLDKRIIKKDEITLTL